jgi:hypothetical protein
MATAPAGHYGYFWRGYDALISYATSSTPLEGGTFPQQVTVDDTLKKTKRRLQTIAMDLETAKRKLQNESRADEREGIAYASRGDTQKARVCASRIAIANSRITVIESSYSQLQTQIGMMETFRVNANIADALSSIATALYLVNNAPNSPCTNISTISSALEREIAAMRVQEKHTQALVTNIQRQSEQGVATDKTVDGMVEGWVGRSLDKNRVTANSVPTTNDSIPELPSVPAGSMGDQ